MMMMMQRAAIAIRASFLSASVVVVFVVGCFLGVFFFLPFVVLACFLGFLLCCVVLCCASQCVPECGCMTVKSDGNS